MTQNEIIGNNIQQYRDKLGINQEELAAYLGIIRETLSYYENGKRNIPTEIISKSAKLFGVEEYDLFESQEESKGVKLAFIFRAGSMSTEDLQQMADFKKIVLNYLGMKKAMRNESTDPREKGK